jgi:predicted Zn-dependent peptidase
MVASVDVELSALSEGAEILTVTHPGTATLTVAALARRGAAADPPGRAGLAHTVEHLWVAGPVDGEPAAQVLESVGGQLAAATYRHHLRLEARAPLAHASRTLGLLLGLWRRGPHAGRLSAERSAILTEYRSYQETPEVWVSSLAWDALGLDAIFHGFRPELYAGLDDLTWTDVQIWTEHLTPQAWVLFVFSPLSPSDARRSVETALSAHPAAACGGQPVHQDGRPTPRIRPPLAARPRVRVHPRSKGAQAIVGLVLAGPPPDLRGYAALRLLVSALAGGSQGRLPARLRDREGLVYDIIEDLVLAPDLAGLELVTSVAPDRLNRLLKRLRGELEDIATTGLDETEFARAVAYSLGSYEMAMENPHEAARWMSNMYLNSGRIVSPTEWTELMASVGREEVNQLASSLLREGAVAWAVSGPVGPEILRTLTSLGEVEEVDW